MSQHKIDGAGLAGQDYWKERKAREYTAYLQGRASRAEVREAFEALKQALINIRVDFEIFGAYLVAKGIGNAAEFRVFAEDEWARMQAEAAAAIAAAEVALPLPTAEMKAVAADIAGIKYQATQPAADKAVPTLLESGFSDTMEPAKS